MIIALALLATTAGLPVRVHDGDTVYLGNQRVRLDGMDAPDFERSPPCLPNHERHHHTCGDGLADASTAALTAILEGGPITVRYVGDGGYGRPAVRLTVKGEDVSCTMWRTGFAAAPHDRRRYGLPCQPAR